MRHAATTSTAPSIVSVDVRHLQILRRRKLQLAQFVATVAVDQPKHRESFRHVKLVLCVADERCPLAGSAAALASTCVAQDDQRFCCWVGEDVFAVTEEVLLGCVLVQRVYVQGSLLRRHLKLFQAVPDILWRLDRRERGHNGLSGFAVFRLDKALKHFGQVHRAASTLAEVHFSQRLAFFVVRLVVHDSNHSICTRSIKDSCPRSLFQVSADVARLFKRQDECWSAVVRKANNACDLACHRWSLERLLDPRVNGFHLLLLSILQDSFERNGLLLETVQQRDGVLGHNVIFLLNHNQSELGIYSALGTFLAEA